MKPGLYDQNEPVTLGLPAAPGAETIRIFAPSASTDKFSLGVQLIGFKGYLYASWYSAPLHEPTVGREKGAWTAYSRSPDGVQWSAPMVLFPEIKGEGWRAQASFCTDGETLVAYCQELSSFSGGGWQRNFYKTSKDGVTWSDPQVLKDASGEIIGQNIMANPRPLPDGRLLAPFQGNVYRQDIGRVQHVATAYHTRDPLGISGWTRAEMPLLPKDGGNSRELEHNWFRRADGILAMVFRDIGGSQRVLASVSRDQGETWSLAVETDMPDSNSMQTAGNLPDGTAFIVNNPRAARSRTPLVVSLSRDGRQFDRAWLLRSEKDLQPRRFEGRAKGPGYSYPSSVIWGDHLYVGYATNKEDVEITRVPWRQLQSHAHPLGGQRQGAQGTGGPQAAERAVVEWRLPWPDFEKPLAGFPVLAGVEHTEILWATPETGTFNHGPTLQYHDGTFYALWNNHLRDEDRTGQRVLAAISRDGRVWSKPFEVFAAPEPPKPHPAIGYEGRHLTQGGTFSAEGSLYVVAAVRNLKGKGSTGSPWTDERQLLGRIVRKITPSGSLGDVFALADTGIPAAGPGCPAYPPLAASNLPQTPTLLQSTAAGIDPIVTAADGHVLCEHTYFTRPDGTRVVISRDIGPKGDPWASSWRLYAAESSDGRAWTPFVRTDIPAISTKFRAGNLPDGSVYLIGTPVPSIQGEDGARDRHVSLLRDPLVIALSTDGRVFDRAAVIRTELADVRTWKFRELKERVIAYPRFAGRAKDVGPAYPSVLIVKDAMYVLYSIHKEDIAVSRLPLQALTDLQRKE